MDKDEQTITGEFDPGEEIQRLREIAREYSGDRVSRAEEKANIFAAREAMEHVRGPDVLVMGASTGVWAEPLLERFGHFATVDAVPEVISRMRTLYGSKVEGHVSLFEFFQPSRKYSTVVMGHILEHLAEPVGVLRQVRSWLAPGGRIVILVPNAHSLHRIVGVKMGLLPDETSMTPSDETLGHRRVYTWDTLRSHVEEAGLVISHMGGILLKPLSNTQMDPWPHLLLQAFFELGSSFPEHACTILCVAGDGPEGEHS